MNINTIASRCRDRMKRSPRLTRAECMAKPDNDDVDDDDDDDELDPCRGRREAACRPIAYACGVGRGSRSKCGTFAPRIPAPHGHPPPTIFYHRGHLFVPRHRRSMFGRRAFSESGPAAWNSLPDYLRDPSRSTDSFRRDLKTFLFSFY